MDYVLTDDGQELLRRALSICASRDVGWYSLRTLDDIDPDINHALSHQTTSELLGAYAVVQVLLDVASGKSNTDDARDLLSKACLLNQAYIEVAAGMLGLSSGDTWEVFLGESQLNLPIFDNLSYK